MGYDRDNAFSYNESAYYYIDGRARAGLSLYVAPFLRIDGGVQYGTMAYPEPQTVWSGGVARHGRPPRGRPADLVRGPGRPDRAGPSGSA